MADKKRYSLDVSIVCDREEVFVGKMVLFRHTTPNVYDDEIRSFAAACLVEAQKEWPSAAITRVRISE